MLIPGAPEKERRRGERPDVDAVGAPLDEHGPGHHGDDPDLEGEQDPEHLGPDVDVAVAEQPDDGHEQEGPHPPRQVGTAVLGGQALGRGAGQPVDRRLDGGVGEQRQPGGADADRRPEALADVGVEGARVDDVPAHRRVPDAEEQEDDGRDDVGHRVPGAVADGEHDRERAADRGERCGRGDDQEHDADDADRPAQPATARVVGGGCGRGRRGGGELTHGSTRPGSRCRRRCPLPGCGSGRWRSGGRRAWGCGRRSRPA